MRNFSEIGLPAGTKTSGLNYHQPSRTLIAHVGPIKDAPPGKRLYCRWNTDDRYQPIGACQDGVSVENFVLDPSRPALYFITWIWEKSDDDSWSGDRDGLYRFDLETHRCDLLTRQSALLPTLGYEDVWLCEMLSVSSRGEYVFTTAGLLTTPLENGHQHVHYWLTKLELATMKLEPVTRMLATWA
jgi:hypothetical protein